MSSSHHSWSLTLWAFLLVFISSDQLPSTDAAPNVTDGNITLTTPPGSLDAGKYMLEACNMKAKKEFANKGAKPTVIACCLALRISVCVSSQCSSLAAEPGGRAKMSQCRAPSLLALSRNADSSCTMLRANITLDECSALASVANLGLVAGVMIAAFLIITLLCALYTLTASKLKKREFKSKEKRREVQVQVSKGSYAKSALNNNNLRGITNNGSGTRLKDSSKISGATMKAITPQMRTGKSKGLPLKTKTRTGSAPSVQTKVREIKSRHSTLPKLSSLKKLKK